MMTSTTGPSAEGQGRSRGLPHAFSCRGAREGGFTLLELVFVMVIICTVLGMASVSLRGFFASRRTADAAAQIVALTQFARTQAAAEGRMYRVNLDTDDGKYWLTRRRGGVFEMIPTEFGRVFFLPEGTTARWLTPSEVRSVGWIAFYPDGRTEATRVRLTGRRGEIADIVCSSPAEQFRIVMTSDGDTP